VTAWPVRHLAGPAAQLFARPVDLSRVGVDVLEPAGPAVVLGSTQLRGDEPSVPGIEVVRRRSGGGAVWLAPGQQVWVDVSLPAGHPLWRDDVGRAFWWLGEAWALALADLGVPGAAVHRGGLCTTRFSRQVCFAGLGSGEVTVPTGEGPGPKVVGIAQRRTREGALFQCALPRVWDPAPLAAALGLPPDAAAELAGAVLPVPVPAGDAVAALVAHLPTA
jgi:lipoate---protein ligase